MAEYSQLTREILHALAPVERQHADAIDTLVNTLVELEGSRRTSEELYRSALIRIGMAETSALSSQRTVYASVAPFKYCRPVGVTVPALHAAIYGLASREALSAIIGPTERVRLLVAQRNLISALRTLGTFFHNKAGYGVLAAAPFRIDISFDRAYARLTRLCQQLAGPGGSDALLTRVVEDLRHEVGQFWVKAVQEGLATVPMPAVGGSYTAVLNASGRLAQAIGVLPSAPPTGRFAGRRAARHVISIGITEGGSDSAEGRAPTIYGTVLARTYPSRPPGVALLRSSEARARFKRWAAIRGIPTARRLRRTSASGKTYRMSALEAVMSKIAVYGTYGREWMARVVGGTDIAPLRGYARRVLARRVQELLEL